VSRPGLIAATLLALVMPAAPAGAAPGTTLEASVDRNRLGAEDTLVLTVRVQGEGAGRAGAPSLERARDFRVVQGPSVSTQFQWVNGRSFSSKTFTYVLMPRHEGQLQIPALELEVEGTALASQPLTVEVVQGSLGTPPGRRPGTIGRRSPQAPPPIEIEGSQVRVEAELDRERAFVGQQITLTYRIYTQLDITGLELVDAPSYPGFWVEDLKVDPNPVGRRAVRSGEEYTEFTVIKKALFPTRSGRLEIPALTFSLGVRGGGGDPFQGLFFGSGQTVYRKSPPRSVEVEAVPEAGRPRSFGGAVGRFRLTVSPDRQESRVNDAIVLKVRVDGEGNVRSVAPPQLPALADFKAYDPKVEEKSSAEGDRLKGSKVWDFVLLPLAPGPQEIPPLEFSYFDPDSRRYQTVRSSPVRIQVARAAADSGPSTADLVVPREVKPVGRDIHHIKSAPARLRGDSRPLPRSPAFAVTLAVPALGNALLGLWRWRRDRLGGAAGAQRRRRARQRARRSLGRAAQAGDGTPAEFYDAVSRALREYVADKLDRSAAGLTQGEIEQALERAGVSHADRARVRGCLESCDRGRFTPESGRPKARLDLIGQARAAIDSLEGRL